VTAADEVLTEAARKLGPDAALRKLQAEVASARASKTSRPP
jgi:hypothetical protein